MARTDRDPTFGTVLRKLREARGYTQEKVASRSKLSANYIGDVERARRNPTLISVRKILRALGVSWAEFGKLVDETIAESS